jgi:hypothetical protein
LYKEEEEKENNLKIKEEAVEKTKSIDISRTLAYLTDNPVLSIFALGELTLNPDFLKMNLIKLNGFFFILRITVYQIAIAALPLSPGLCILILLITETFLFLISLLKYLKYKHFKKEILLIQKISQSFFLTTFLIILMILNFSESNEPRSFVPVPIKRQILAQYIIVIAILLEIIFTVVVLVGTVRDLILDKQM